MKQYLPWEHYFCKFEISDGNGLSGIQLGLRSFEWFTKTDDRKAGVDLFITSIIQVELDATKFSSLLVKTSPRLYFS